MASYLHQDGDHLKLQRMASEKLLHLQRNLMRHSSAILLVAVSMSLMGCATHSLDHYLGHYQIQNPEVGGFTVCKSYGCKKTSWLSYTDAEWESIRAIFTPAPVRADQERDRIRRAIGKMEQIIGSKNDTGRDNARNKIRGAQGNQLDCIAEATNTTVALLLLEKEGLLRFHQTAAPQHHGFLQLQGPHHSASIIELGNGNHYAVDSWFHAGGKEPEIVTVEAWKSGFDPD